MRAWSIVTTITWPMANEEKIVAFLEKQEQTLESIQAAVKALQQEQERLEQGQAQHKTALQVLATSLHDIRDDMQTLHITQKTLATVKDADFNVDAAKREIQSDLNTVRDHVIGQVLFYRTYRTLGT